LITMTLPDPKELKQTWGPTSLSQPELHLHLYLPLPLRLRLPLLLRLPRLILVKKQSTYFYPLYGSDL
jgi:hypothetical protein